MTLSSMLSLVSSCSKTVFCAIIRKSINKKADNKMKNICMIACISSDGGIGKDGGLIWNIKDDMQYFKETTMGTAVVMGYKTFLSIGRPLPGRRNIVLSSHEQNIPGIEWCHSVTELEQLLTKLNEDIFIIGGASLYNMFVNRASYIYLTEVDNTKPADTFFPEFDRNKFSRQVVKEGATEGINFTIAKYSRL